MNQYVLLCLKAITDAQISVAGMVAENKHRELCGLQIAYDERDFEKVQIELNKIFNLYIKGVP